MNPTAPFNTRFFPQHVTFLVVGNNMMPMGYWTVISKDPFRFLVCVEKGNYTLELLRKHKEAALHFMPWSERERVVRAGFISGRHENKMELLGFAQLPAEKLTTTNLIEGADSIYETVIHSELEGLSTEFGVFVLDVVATHGKKLPKQREPILYLSVKDFATFGERWKYER